MYKLEQTANRERSELKTSIGILVENFGLLVDEVKKLNQNQNAALNPETVVI
jgi:hypothetical protein